MVELDDIFNAIGKIAVAVAGLSALAIVLLTVSGHMGTARTIIGDAILAPSPTPTALPAPTPDPAGGLRDAALNDYNYKLELVDEQTQRLDTYYAAKAGSLMGQGEFHDWLEVMDAQTEDFISRENNATESGKSYLGYLDRNGSEYKRVIMNEATAKNDTGKEIQNYNNNVAIYNEHWGPDYGYIANLTDSF